jgi:hypothetical protein
MKYSNSQQRRTSGSRSSRSSAVNPYCIEDIAMTPGELRRARGAVITVVGPR